MSEFSQHLAEPSWGGLSRRGFLKGVLIGASGAGLGASLASCASNSGQGADGKPLLLLNASEAATLTALGNAIIPGQKGFPSLAEAEVIARIDEELSFVSESIQQDMHAAISALEFAPLIYGRFSRYSRLDSEARRDILGKMMQSRSEILRAVGTNLKVLIHFMYFGHRSSWDAIGYDGPFSKLPQSISEQRQHYAKQTGRTSA